MKFGELLEFDDSCEKYSLFNEKRIVIEKIIKKD
tara:strand:- start:180 stop:281 length:102 start_codon:yes stop_codon:yes gene_type:complete